MGNCLCKNGNDEDCDQNQTYTSSRASGATILLDNHHAVEAVAAAAAASETPPNFKFPTSANIDKLVLEILGVIGLLVDK